MAGPWSSPGATIHTRSGGETTLRAEVSEHFWLREQEAHTRQIIDRHLHITELAGRWGSGIGVTLTVQVPHRCAIAHEQVVPLVLTLLTDGTRDPNLVWPLHADLDRQRYTRRPHSCRHVAGKVCDDLLVQSAQPLVGSSRLVEDSLYLRVGFRLLCRSSGAVEDRQQHGRDCTEDTLYSDL